MDQNNSSRFVRAVHTCEWNNTKLILPCGCALVECKVCGVKHSAMKCALHQPVPHYSQDYYLHELRGVYSNIPQHRKICIELETALMNMGVEIPTGSVTQNYVLDIGGGIGIYAPFFMKRGYRYELLEADIWAGKYAAGAYDCPVHACKFEDFTEKYSWSIVNAVHILEHLTDAPGALQKMVRILNPGGRLILVVPDQTDLCNPDHIWFFNESAIRKWFEEAGLVDIRSHVAQVIALEKFMYITAIKPAVTNGV